MTHVLFALRQSPAAVAMLAAFALASCGPSGSEPKSGGAQSSCATRAYDHIGGPFSLIDHTGKPVTQDDYKGQESLVYFGFTNCPDVCPFALQTIGAAMDLLPDNVEKPRTLLISVDSEQDTPEVMAAYIRSNTFPEDIVGLTGADADIKAAANAFMSSYKRIDTPDTTLGYTMDHTSILFLMDKDWKLKTFFTSEASAQTIATCIAQLQ